MIKHSLFLNGLALSSVIPWNIPVVSSKCLHGRVRCERCPYSQGVLQSLQCLARGRSRLKRKQVNRSCDVLSMAVVDMPKRRWKSEIDFWPQIEKQGGLALRSSSPQTGKVCNEALHKPHSFHGSGQLNTYVLDLNTNWAMLFGELLAAFANMVYCGLVHFYVVFV